MTSKTPEVSQGDGGASLPPSQPGPPPEHQRSRGSNGNTIYKSGPLFISSKGIGWTSWKKRWFVLTRTSLVFFRSDPNAAPQKGGEVNLTLGGIDLNNSGSVVVKADKKLLTMLFPDGRDGRAFTLKADTTEDLYEWKTALENALAQAPSASTVTGQNGIFKSEQTDSIDNSSDHVKDVEPVKSTVIGRPILLALEDVDGTPTFLEKALRFIEEHGVKVEGLLRQAADVDHVEHRVREYEQGKTEFSAEEDAHVIGDCVKLVIRELPSSPVPASCCKALLEACRTERSGRISAIRAAICETFPEPNRRLLQRILQMMQIVASHKAVNRMSSSAVAACMAPLLLRPLMAGECNVENDFDVGGDGSVQLLQAAAAANHAQTICITLLEEYESIFGEGTVSPDMYTDSEVSGSGSEEGTEDDESYDEEDDDDYDDEECDDECDEESIQESDVDAEGNETEDLGGKDDKVQNHDHSKSDLNEDPKVSLMSIKSSEVLQPQPDHVKSSENLMSAKTASVEKSIAPADIIEGASEDQSTAHNSINASNGPERALSHTVLGRTAAIKNLNMEPFDHSTEEAQIETLEAMKVELQNQIAEEAKANPHSYLERQKKVMHERHWALEQDVARLQEQLQKETTLEAGDKHPSGALSDLTNIDEKTKADLEELALVEADLTNLRQRIEDLGKRFKKNKLDAEAEAASQAEKSSKDAHSGSAESTSYKFPLQVSSKKAGVKVEQQVANFTSNTLNKLTNRLNFLKERQTQQSPGPNTKPRASETYSVSYPEKGRALDSSQPPQVPDRGSVKEAQSHQNSDKFRKSDSQHHMIHQSSADKHLERGKSEIHHSYHVDKGR